jgi:peptide/nickel transport system substrate-binding protein
MIAFSLGTAIILVPWLVESYEMVNTLTWRIRLKKGIRFQNGEPFTADSVKYSLDYILDPSNKSMYISYINRIDRIKIIDNYVIEITTKQPFPTLLGNFTDIGMAPPKLAREKGMAYINEHPVGTGHISWKVGLGIERFVSLEMTSTGWGAPIRKLTFRIIPDVGARVAALMAGEIHLMEQVPIHLSKQITSSATATVKGIAGRRTVFLSFD